MRKIWSCLGLLTFSCQYAFANVGLDIENRLNKPTATTATKVRVAQNNSFRGPSAVTGPSGFTAPPSAYGFAGQGGFTGSGGYTAPPSAYGFTGSGSFSGPGGYTAPPSAYGHTGPNSFSGPGGYTAPSGAYGHTGSSSLKGPGSFTAPSTSTGYTGSNSFTGPGSQTTVGNVPAPTSGRIQLTPVPHAQPTSSIRPNLTPVESDVQTAAPNKPVSHITIQQRTGPMNLIPPPVPTGSSAIAHTTPAAVVPNATSIQIGRTVSNIVAPAWAQSCLNPNSYSATIDYVYCGAVAVDATAGFLANRIVPGGGAAYSIGGLIGEQMMQPLPNWQLPPTPSPFMSTTTAPSPFISRSPSPAYGSPSAR